ncbi:MAG: hypothetical protein PHQ80_03905 [Candidatus ainarchaeum sp.]|nr:hypothetical protein [Candidatus ainarchaeum sp.]
MTAEIAIMNHEAVALAADSAVTLSEGKIFPSANKIFALTKCAPVGIMLYQNPSLTKIPLETLIKTYRKRLGKKRFNKLDDYASDFLKFLGKETRHIPEKEQKQFFVYGVHFFFHKLRGDIKERLVDELSNKKTITYNDIVKIFVDAINQEHKSFSKLKSSKSIIREKYLFYKNRNIIRNIRDKFFGKAKFLPKHVCNKLDEMGLQIFTRNNVVTPFHTGIVIAGFGEKEVMPALTQIIVDGVFDNKIIIRHRGSESIDFDAGATVMAFAQKEMVTRFMDGIDPEFNADIDKFIWDLLINYPSVILDNIPRLNQRQKMLLLKKTRKLAPEILKKYRANLKDYKRNKFSEQITEIVLNMPKAELAAAAESLVSLTSFKRKISKQRESVGGPIDVAVISKGDGFVWIKKKQYFKQELNPAFILNYSGGD